MERDLGAADVAEPMPAAVRDAGGIPPFAANADALDNAQDGQDEGIPNDGSLRSLGRGRRQRSPSLCSRESQSPRGIQ
jgi:hypothetical protein